MLNRFRPIRKSDLSAVYALSLEAGFGLTTLAKDEAALSSRIALSEQSFAKSVTTPKHENYLFVLEDVTTGKVVGTSAIEAAAGFHLPFYSYRLTKTSKVCPSLDIRLDNQTLILTNDFQGYSEIGTLFLHQDYRKNNNGLLLSRARFLFMALNPKRFSTHVIAEMRGVSDEDGVSPFWESLGKKFFPMSFSRADELSVLTDKQFIADLMPHHPIYTKLLSQPAQDAIGKPHASTIPAMKILEREGFYYNHHVDIFDAGPTIKAKVSDIKTVKNSLSLIVKSVSDDVHAEPCFVSNCSLDFYVALGQVMIEDNDCIISRETAELIGVKIGDKIQVVPIKIY